MIAASGPPARQPLLGDGNHLIESLLGPRCERFVTCSRRGKVFPFHRDFLRIGFHCEEEKKKEEEEKYRRSCRTRRTDVEDSDNASKYFQPWTHGFPWRELLHRGEWFIEIGLEPLVVSRGVNSKDWIQEVTNRKTRRSVCAM